MNELIIKKAGNKEFSPYVRMLLFGESGSGKTRFALTAPNPIFAAAAPGMTTLSKAGARYVDIQNENDLFELKIALEKGIVEADTLVIDSVDEFQSRLFAQRFAAERRDPSIVKNEDWNWLAAKMNGIFDSLNELPLHIIYITHSKDIGGFDGEDLVVKPNLIGSFANQVYKYVDYVCHIEISGPRNPDSSYDEVKFLRTRPSKKYPTVHDQTDTLDPFIDVNFNNDFFAFVESRRLAVSQSSEEVLEVNLLEPVEDEPTKDTNVPGMSKQDKIAKMLKTK